MHANTKESSCMLVDVAGDSAHSTAAASPAPPQDAFPTFGPLLDGAVDVMDLLETVMRDTYQANLHDAAGRVTSESKAHAVQQTRRIICVLNSIGTVMSNLDECTRVETTQAIVATFLEVHGLWSRVRETRDKAAMVADSEKSGTTVSTVSTVAQADKDRFINHLLSQAALERAMGIAAKALAPRPDDSFPNTHDKHDTHDTRTAERRDRLHRIQEAVEAFLTTIESHASVAALLPKVLQSVGGSTQRLETYVLYGNHVVSRLEAGEVCTSDSAAAASSIVSMLKAALNF